MRNGLKTKINIELNKQNVETILRYFDLISEKDVQCCQQ